MDTIKVCMTMLACQMDELNDDDRTLVEQAISATSHSYAPYSHFKVGACIRRSDGTTLIGANQENAATPVSLCAERTAIFASQAQNPELAITAIAIAARDSEDNLTVEPISPCGSCRQVIREMEERYSRDIRILLYGQKCIYAIDSVKDILPLSFCSDDLNASYKQN